jgi:hypothetical protein
LDVKRVITLVLYNRPAYTREVLDALRRCDGVGDYVLLPHIEPGNEEVLALVKAVDFAEVRITLNREKLGIGRNTYLAWEHGARLADFFIHIEDDTVPARDCLRYMEHCREAYGRDQEIFSVAAYNRSPCPPSAFYQVARRRPYTCWLIGTWRDRWEWIRRRWEPNPARYAVNVTNQLSHYDLKEIHPLLSRSQNIGALGGAGVPSAEWHRLHHHTEHWAGNHDLPPGRYFEAPPLVTAVMVTGLDRSRYPLARIAIRCFQRQTHPNRELLIINHGCESLACGDERVRELRVRKRKTDTVGDLRNIGLKHASGDFILNWDDDDWHHPMRITTQMKAQEEDAAVFLANRVHYSFQNRCACCVRTPDGAPATILHPRAVKHPYPRMVRGSDSVFAQQFEKRAVIDNDPALQVRFHHGLNLWDAGHIMGSLADPSLRNRLRISNRHKTLLAQVVALYRGWSPPPGLSATRARR